MRNIPNTQNLKPIWELRAVSRICELYPDICLTTEEKARKNLGIKAAERVVDS
jgi:hypothetical protein